MSVGQGFLRFWRHIYDRLEGLAEDISNDPLVQRALEADFGLPPGALDKAKTKRPDTSGIDQYINDANPSMEKLVLTFEAMESYVKFWKGVFDAAKQEDSSIVVDEMVIRLFQVTTVDLLKYDYPFVYALMRLLGAIYQNVLLSAEELFAPEAPANIFTGEYWHTAIENFPRHYLNFRLDQVGVLQPCAPDENLSAEEKTRLQQLSFAVFGLSDLFLYIGTYWLLVELIGKKLAKDSGLKIAHYYGWELPPGDDVLLADHIASRGYTFQLSVPVGDGDTASAVLTQFLLADEDGKLGWFLALRGGITFEETAGSKERPLKIKIKVKADNGVDIALRFSGDNKFSFSNTEPSVGMQLSIEPAQASTSAPPISILERSGTRVEIGDFSFKLDLSKEGFKVKAGAKKSALVIVSSEGDGLVSETLKTKETRIDFQLGITADQNGVSLDSGGRLSTTISVNKSFGSVKVQALQLALTPSKSETGSELEFTATTSLGFKLGPLQMTAEQIGFHLDVGFSTGELPDDAFALLPFMYGHKPGFKSPNGIGILVDCGVVTGGGFLRLDPEKHEYQGVLQLEMPEISWLGGRTLSLTAIGLLNTRLPDGSKGFSLLIIISVEFDPAFQLGLGFTLSGIGGLLGIHRTLDADALREGLRHHALDAILFPKDPVANAGRLFSVLSSVFPPARDRHLLGLALILGWGTPSVITAELAVIYEFGDNPRLVLLGQLHLAFPQKSPKKFLEMHLDAAGIWDINRHEFSLDARLYDSHIAFVTLDGDMALRIHKGDDPYFLFSVGGYHPEFAVPPNFPKLERLRIKLADTDNLRLILTGYIAITSNTRQIGANMEFYIKVLGFSLEGHISFDALWEPDVRFIFDFDVDLKLKFKGRTLAGVAVSGRFTGPQPKRVQGEWSIDLFLFSYSRSFDKTFGDDRPPAELAGIDPLPELVTALKDPHNWSAQLPARSRMLVSLRKQDNSDQVVIHPLGELSVRQQVLPLGIQIDRFAGGVPSGERLFAITQASLGDGPVTNIRSADEFFAVADFIEMSDDEKIARPSFEALSAGVVLQSQGLTFGSQTAASDIDFDDKIVSPEGVSSTGAVGVILRAELVAAAAGFGQAARSPLRKTGVERFRVSGPAFRLREPGFVVAGVDDLQTVATAPTGASFTAVKQALQRHLQTHPQAKGDLQVVPSFQVKETP